MIVFSIAMRPSYLQRVSFRSVLLGGPDPFNITVVHSDIG